MNRLRIGPATSIALLIGGLLVVWLYTGVVLLGVLGNVAALPVWIVLGSSITPGAILLGLVRLVPAQSRPRGAVLVGGATAGGALAIIIGGSIDALIPPDRHAGVVDEHALLLGGFIEEACKALVVIVILRFLPRLDVVSALLVGAAVGCGFAAFESMGYATISLLYHGITPASLVGSGAVQLERQLLIPLTHPLWTALLAGLLVALRRRGRVARWSGSVIAYLGVSCIHSLWDGAERLDDRILGPHGTVFAAGLIAVGTVIEAGVLWRLLRTRADPPDSRALDQD